MDIGKVYGYRISISRRQLRRPPLMIRAVLLSKSSGSKASTATVDEEPVSLTIRQRNSISASRPFEVTVRLATTTVSTIGASPVNLMSTGFGPVNLAHPSPCPQTEHDRWCRRSDKISLVKSRTAAAEQFQIIPRLTAAVEVNPSSRSKSPFGGLIIRKVSLPP